MGDKTKQIKEDIVRMVDVFGCSDGGAEFIMFKCFMENIARQANEGDHASIELCNIFNKFRKLVDVGIKSTTYQTKEVNHEKR